MLIEIFISLQIAAISLLVLSLILNNVRSEAALLLLVIATLLFFVVGIAGFNIEKTVAVIENDVITTSTITYSSFAIAWLNIGIGFISAILLFYQAFLNFKENK